MSPPNPPAAGRRGRRLRLLALLALLLVAGALAARAALGLYAADLFAAVLARAASAAGFTVSMESAPTVSARGFRLAGLRLLDAEGSEVVAAREVVGDAELFFGDPWVRLSLRVLEARVPIRPAKGAGGGEAGRAPLVLPELPEQLGVLGVEDAVVDLGGGTSLTLSGSLGRAQGAGLHLVATKLDYVEESMLRAAEGLRGDALVRQDGAGAPLRVEARIEAGVALAGAVLLDLASHPAAVAASLSPREDGGWSIAELTGNLGKLVRVRGRVDLDGNLGAIAGDLEAESEDLGAAFVTFVREPFGGVLPTLGDAELSGRARLSLAFDAPLARRAQGALAATIPRLRTRSIEADAVELVLPWIGASVPKAAARRGHLRAKSLSLYGVPLVGIDASLAASAGLLRAEGKQNWATLGGKVILDGVELRDDAREGPRLTGRVGVDGVDLARVGEVAGIQGLKGTLGGDLGPVRIDAGRVRADGSLEARTLGGLVRVSRPFVEDPFGRVPSIGLDASVEDLDLASLTALLGVGRVSGVLEGSVRSLVVADAQPVSFEADLHTIKRRGVDQTVDVLAIAQLGVLGGDSGSVTSRLLKVFERYRYSKMGLRCRLHNDVFEIRGVESEGGRDYIVRGSLLPPSVSVVSHSQVVSFSEMLRRIERISAIGEGGSSNAETP